LAGSAAGREGFVDPEQAGLLVTAVQPGGQAADKVGEARAVVIFVR